MPYCCHDQAARRRGEAGEASAMRLGTEYSGGLRAAAPLLMAMVMAGCSTTSGSTRLDETGQQMAAVDTGTDQPENSAFYLQALKGGLVARMGTIKISKSDRARALEAEYKALETAPGGQKVLWAGDDSRGEIMAASPYQVGSQNCRQYSHAISIDGSAPLVARGAACRNTNGSWTPLS